MIGLLDYHLKCFTIIIIIILVVTADWYIFRRNLSPNFTTFSTLILFLWLKNVFKGYILIKYALSINLYQNQEEKHNSTWCTIQKVMYFVLTSMKTHSMTFDLINMHDMQISSWKQAKPWSAGFTEQHKHCFQLVTRRPP